MTKATSFFHSTGWRVFVRALVPILLFLGLAPPHTLQLSGLSHWWQIFELPIAVVSHLIELLPYSKQFSCDVKVPRYIFVIPVFLAFGATLVWLWRAGRPAALVCAIVMTGLYGYVEVFAVFSYELGNGSFCAEMKNLRGG